MNPWPTSVPTPDVASLLEPLEAVAKRRHLEIRGCAVFYPGGERAHRRYVMALGGKGRAQLFTKVTTKPEIDGTLMRAENGMLQHFSKAPLADWMSPVSHGIFSGPGLLALTLDPLPRRRRNLRWPHLLGRLPLKYISDQSQPTTRTASSLAWFPNDLTTVHCSDTFRAILESTRQSPVAIRTVHGDISTSNAFLSANQFWLVDWEFSSREGPASADVVGGQLRRLVARADDAQKVRQMLMINCRILDVTVQEIVLSILYLSTFETPWPKALMQLSWPCTKTDEWIG